MIERKRERGREERREGESAKRIEGGGIGGTPL